MVTVRYTILGGKGFIGRALVETLSAAGHTVFSPRRDQLENNSELLLGRELGHVIYCIGLTSDFRTHPLETIDAHVCLLNRVLRICDFLSLTYLSSARLYANAESTREDTRLLAEPHLLDSLYNITKMMGESACLHGSDRARVVRLSNVYGVALDSEGFLMSILTEAIANGRVKMKTSPRSSKDYVSLHDVVRLLPNIAENGDFGIYNLASGLNVSNEEIASCLMGLGVAVEFLPSAPLRSFPIIDIKKISEQFEPPKNRLMEDLPDLLNEVRREYDRKKRSS
jgi:nucleoside-diphosphate-sugar epimerase